jgi:hypothetical protein
MPRVMILCPETKKPVYTGVKLDERGFERPTIRNALQGTVAGCPHCAQDHQWRGEDAYLEGEGEDPSGTF